MTISPELDRRAGRALPLPARVVAYANYALGRETCPRAAGAAARRPPRLVYQGTLSTNGGHYDLRDLFAAIAEQGISLDVYMARVVPEYREIPGIRVHDPLPLTDLLRELGHYDFGWAGFNAGLNGAHLDTALPNKLYEYLGCGLPVITLQHRALRRMLGEEGVGIALDDVGELASALADADVAALRRRVAERRERFTVESQIHRIAALYARCGSGARAAGSSGRQRRLGRGRFGPGGGHDPAG